MENEKQFNTAKIKNFTDAFAFLMANRHKQNEVIKELEEQEKKALLTESSEAIDSEIKNPILNGNNLDQIFHKVSSNESKYIEGVIIDTKAGTPKLLSRRESKLATKKLTPNFEENKVVNISSPDVGLNAFHWLMTSRSRSKESPSTDIAKVSDIGIDFTKMISPSSSKRSELLHNIENVSYNKNTEKCKLPTALYTQATSPNGLKLNLINDTEELNIEETFKVEISECGLKKSKTFRKAASGKLKQKKVNSKGNQSQVCITTEKDEIKNAMPNFDVANIVSSVEPNVEKLQSNSGNDIAKFFLSLSSQSNRPNCNLSESSGKKLNCSSSKLVLTKSCAIEENIKVSNEGKLEKDKILINSKSLEGKYNFEKEALKGNSIKKKKRNLSSLSRNSNGKSKENKDESKYVEPDIKESSKVNTLKMSTSKQLEIFKDFSTKEAVSNNDVKTKIMNGEEIPQYELKCKSKANPNSLRSIRKNKDDTLSTKKLNNAFELPTHLEKKTLALLASPQKNKLFMIFDKRESDKNIPIVSDTNISMVELDSSVDIINDNISELSVSKDVEASTKVNQVSRSVKKSKILKNWKRSSQSTNDTTEKINKKLKSKGFKGKDADESLVNTHLNKAVMPTISTQLDKSNWKPKQNIPKKNKKCLSRSSKSKENKSERDSLEFEGYNVISNLELKKTSGDSTDLLKEVGINCDKPAICDKILINKIPFKELKPCISENRKSLPSEIPQICTQTDIPVNPLNNKLFKIFDKKEKLVSNEQIPILNNKNNPEVRSDSPVIVDDNICELSVSEDSEVEVLPELNRLSKSVSKNSKILKNKRLSSTPANKTSEKVNKKLKLKLVNKIGTNDISFNDQLTDEEQSLEINLVFEQKNSSIKKRSKKSLSRLSKSIENKVEKDPLDFEGDKEISNLKLNNINLLKNACMIKIGSSTVKPSNKQENRINEKNNKDMSIKEVNSKLLVQPSILNSLKIENSNCLSSRILDRMSDSHLEENPIEVVSVDPQNNQHFNIFNKKEILASNGAISVLKDITIQQSDLHKSVSLVDSVICEMSISEENENESFAELRRSSRSARKFRKKNSDLCELSDEFNCSSTDQSLSDNTKKKSKKKLKKKLFKGKSSPNNSVNKLIKAVMLAKEELSSGRLMNFEPEKKDCSIRKKSKNSLSRCYKLKYKRKSCKLGVEENTTVETSDSKQSKIIEEITIIENKSNLKNGKIIPLKELKSKSLVQPSILKSLGLEKNKSLPAKLPHSISDTDSQVQNVIEVVSGDSRNDNLFKVFEKKSPITNVIISDLNDLLVNLVDDDICEMSVSENKVESSAGLRRSSRSIKKPKVLTYDSFYDETRSPLGKRNVIKVNSTSNDISETPPKHIRKKKLSKSKDPLSLEDDESWNSFKKSPSMKKLSSNRRKKIKIKISTINKISESSSSENNESDDCIEIVALDESVEGKPSHTKEENTNKQFRAFASIFNIKVPPTKEEIERQKAREDFLFSESPVTESMKLLMTSDNNDDELCYAPFSSHSHVRQKNDDEFWNLQELKGESFLEDTSDIEFQHLEEKFEWKNEVSTTVSANIIKETPILTPTSMYHILSYLSHESPTLKIFSYFKELLKVKEDALDVYYKETVKNTPNVEQLALTSNGAELNKQETKRKRNIKSLSRSKRRKLSHGEKNITTVQEEIPVWHRWNPFLWNQLFSPSNAEFFIGDIDNIRMMKEWFSYWKVKTEKLVSRNDNPWKSSTGGNADDSDSNDSDGSYSNTMLITGSPGVGKTAIVYSLAQQFGFKVLEINASSQRQGKQVMTQLLEATQSHTVSSKSSFASLSTPAVDVVNSSSSNKIGSISKSSQSINSTQESRTSVESSKAKALILIEDIDVVFEDSDEGFMSAINALMATTKRPIILTLEHNSPVTMSKLREKYEIFCFAAIESSKIARYLQVMCLADGLFVNFEDIKRLVEVNNNDIRKSIQDLQFWQITGSSNMKMSTVEIKIDEGKLIDDPLFTNVSLQTSTEITIAHDCLWTHPTLKESIDKKYLSKIDWKLISPNIPFLYNFPHSEKQVKLLMYPLQGNDPYIQTAKLLQSVNGDMFEFDTPPKKKLNSPQPKSSFTEGKESSSRADKFISSEGRAVVGNCLKHMFTLHRTLSDVDILASGFDKASENKSAFKLNSHFASSYPGLESPQSEFSYSYSSLIHHSDDIIQSISSKVLLSTTNAVEEGLKSFFDAKEFLQMEKCSSLVLHPCSYENKNLLSRLQIQEKLEQYLTLSTMTNRGCLQLDYYPFIREIARMDQLSEALHKMKQQRRFLPQMKQLGFYFSSQDLNKMCNVFKNS